MRVLVATDGSPAAEVAVDLAAGIGWPAGTTIRVVRAVETGPALFGGPWPAIALAEIESLEQEVRSVAATTVEEARPRLERPGVVVESQVLEGRPATAIVDAARAMDADLVVVGSRGHGTIQSMLLGSVSGEVVDHASAPVLVARARSLRRAVLAWDGSDCGRRAADLVRTWPIFDGVSVRVVSVADITAPWWSGFPGTGSGELVPMYMESADASRRVHDDLAAAMASELVGAGREAAAELREGDPATEIIAAARASSADLIVLGTHGRTGLSRIVLGSVARNVLHHAASSVLIVREPARGG